MSYKRKSKEDKVLDEFPGLSQEDLDAVDDLYESYLFFEKEKGGRQIWTTCCHHKEHIPELAELMTPESGMLLSIQHGDEMRCPWCGRYLKVKNRKMMRSAWKHTKYMPVLILHASEDGDTVYAQGYWTKRDHLADPQGHTLYMVTYVYRFRRGEVMVWERDRYGRRGVQPFRFGKDLRIPEPASRGGICAGVEPYDVIGMNRLQDSFLKYTMYDQPVTAWERRHWEEAYLRADLANYLAAAARWPEGVEMLRKVGLNDPVIDLVYAGKKNADVMKWDELDPRKVFGLSKPDLKAFLQDGGDMQRLRIWKGLRATGSEITWERARTIDCLLSAKTFREVIARAKRFKIRGDRLITYFEKQSGQRCHGGYFSAEDAAIMWRDYVDAAVIIGYDMTNPINQMPKNLDLKHNEATSAAEVLRKALKDKEVKERTARLNKRYGFEDERYFIRAPHDAKEIVAEGKALAHCVGGYADRHATGTTTILFLRSKAEPDKPYVTIEMDGNEIRQIHGYNNDLGRGAVSPMITHQKLLHDWRAWLKAGSKRNKHGEPVMPKSKEKKRENAA